MDVTIHAMSADQIPGYVPPAVMNIAKQNKDVLETYTVAHTDITTPTVDGLSSMLYVWPQEMVETIRVEKGTPLFNGHTDGDVMDPGREKVGEVVMSFWEDNKLKILGRRFGKYRDLKFMACSLEAKVKISIDDMIKRIVTMKPGMMKRITGIALLQEGQSPSFRYANKESYMYCYSGGKMEFTIDQIEEICKNVVSEALKKTKSFDLKASEASPEAALLKNLMEQNEALRGEVQDLKGKMSQLKQAHAAALKEAEGRYAPQLNEHAKFKAQREYDAEMDRRANLTDSQKKFLKKHWEKINVTHDEKFDVDAAIKNGLSDFDNLQSIFAPESPGGNAAPGNITVQSPAPVGASVML